MSRASPASIRPAASLLVVLRSDSPRVLMGRRPAGARFMPGVYVFPGGALETQDRTIPVIRDLDARDARLTHADGLAEARALAVAAIRETWEETGVLCAAPEAASSWSEIAEGSHRLDLSRLRYLGRALTPAVSRIRFHARFFYTFRDEKSLPNTGSDELEDLRWVDPAGTGNLPIPNVTRFMLGELHRRLASREASGDTPYYYRESDDYIVEYERAEP